MLDSRWAWTFPAALFLVACSAGPRNVTTDLLQQRPDIVSPTRVIKAADESTRQLLQEGVSLAEDGRLAISSEAERLAFAFHIPEPRDVRVALRGEAALPFRGSVSVNDIRLSDVAFANGIQETLLSLPAQDVEAGLNTVTIELPPSTPASPLVRASLESISIGDGSQPVRWTQGAAPSLEQAPDSEVTWLVGPEGDRLDLAGSLAAPKEADCVAEVLAETDRMARSVLWRSAVKAAGQRAIAGEIDLGALSEAPARLTLRFRSSRSDASITWSRLRVTRASAAGRRPAAAPRARHRPNVLVFLVDTLRPDHLSLYGYTRVTSPELQRFAAEAVVFDNAWAQSSWTNPSVASLFTGEYPSAHGIRDHHGKLAPDFLTVAEFLKARGYATTGLVVNTGVGAGGGFEQGFDAFEYLPGAEAEHVVDLALDRTGRTPFFIYVHVMDPHYPYTKARPPFDALVREQEGSPIRAHQLSMANLRRRKIVPTAAELDYLRSLYDSEVAYVDHSFGRLVQGLKDRGLFASALIVFVSDHGEEFADHGGYYHGHTLFNELTHAALVIRPPGGLEPRTVHGPAQTIDVYPTIAAAVGQLQERLPGRDLLRLPAHAGADPADEPAVFCETDLRDRLKSVVMGRHKLVLQDRRAAGLADPAWLFDLVVDPGERTNQRGREPIRADYMASVLRRHLEWARGRSAGEARRTLSEEALRELQALGYIDAGSQ